MRDARTTHVAQSRAGSGHRSRAVWEVAGFVAALLLSAPFFWL
jgi:hypothetical protein